MGREIRRVPVGWEPPRDSDGEGFQPQCDRPFAEAAREWMDSCLAWEAGTHEDAPENKVDHPFYWQWAGDPPDPAYYRPDWIALGLMPTGYAVYETVSEGTPVTPAFSTQEELVEYLVAHGDYWDQKRGSGGWRRENARRFVMDTGYAPSLIVERTPGHVTIQEPRDQ